MDSFAQDAITSYWNYSEAVKQAKEICMTKNSLAFSRIIKELILAAYKDIIDTIDDILTRIKEFTLGEQVTFLENYLKENNYSYLNKEIMDYYYHKYDKPNENFFWIKCTKETKEKFNQWLLKQAIEEAFGNDERSTYWKRHINNCKDFFIYKDEFDGNIIMFYSDFVVVEFTRIGNAAYFYDTSVFNDIFSKYQLEQYRVKPSLLKKQYEAITKKNHSGAWTFKFDDIMDKLLKGRREEL